MQMANELQRIMSLMGQDITHAEQEARIFIARSPSSQAYELLALILSRQQRYDETVQALKQSISVEPSLASAHFNLAYIYQQLGQVSLAQEVYCQASQLPNSTFKSFSALLSGMCLHQLGLPVAAIETYKKILHVQPKEERVKIALLQAYKEINTFQAAKHLEISAINTTTIQHFTTYDDYRWQDFDHKAQLNHWIQKYNQQTKKPFNAYPSTFLLPDQYSEFRKYFNKQGEQYWLIKPVNYSGGQGAYLINDLQQIKSQPGWIAQQYVYNPLLIEGHKFNMRLYIILISGFQPRVYLWRNGVVFISPEPYNIEALDNRAAHIVNPLCCMFHPNLIISNVVADDHKGNLWQFKTLLKYLKTKSIDVNSIQESIIDLAKGVVNIARFAKIPPFENKPLTLHAHPLKIIGLDMMLDDQLQPHLMEIERFPGLSAPEKDVISRHIKTELLTDVGEILLTPLSQSATIHNWLQLLRADEKKRASKFIKL